MRHHLADALRADERGRRRGPARAAPGGWGAGLDQLAPQLAHQERVAPGLADQHVDRRGGVGQPLAAAGELDEAAHLVAVEPAEHEAGHPGLAPQVREGGLEVLADLGGVDRKVATTHSRSTPGLRTRWSSSSRRGPPGPVEVVEHEQHRALGRDGAQRVDHRAEQPVPLGPGIVRDLARRLGRPGRTGQPGHSRASSAPRSPTSHRRPSASSPATSRSSATGEGLVRNGRLLAALAVEHGGPAGGPTGSTR